MGFEVEFDEVDEKPPDLENITREEMEKAAIRTKNGWQENMRSEGWVNTGETVNSIHVERRGEEILIGTDKVAALIHEFGRAPNNTMPPEDPIKDWVKDVGIASPADDDFDSVVWAIRKSIAREGIQGNPSAQEAFDKATEQLVEDLEGRLDAEVSLVEK